MRIRAMIAEDGEETLRLFCDTVRGGCAEDYTPRQIEAWIGKRDVGAWTQSFFGNRRALVAEENGKIVGFADMTDGGYFDRLYVHREYQRRGIAAALADALEGESAAPVFTVDASLTARGFFERRGYLCLRENIVERAGERLVNFSMEKRNRASG